MTAFMEQEVPLDCQFTTIGKTLVIKHLTYQKFFKLSVNEDDTFSHSMQEKCRYLI
jgi:hypothetical protein